MSKRKIKFMALSNAHFVGSGYGVQSNLFLKQMLNDDDFDTPIMANFYGLSGAQLTIEGIPTLPTTLEQYGGDAVNEQIARHKPDVYMILCDAWVYNPQSIAQASQHTDLVMYAPIDHEPAPPKVIEVLRQARRVWAMSRHGERAMRAAGLNPDYVPHGVDLSVYYPMDKADARRATKLPDDWFVVSTVGANKGFPDRKSLRSIFKAWAAWIRRYPNSLLICHSNPSPVHSGLDLNALRQYYGIPDANIRMPNPYDLFEGTYTAEHLRQIYAASDVYLNASMGGGFEVPVIDAQASGAPVIVSGLTGQAELGQAGYIIPIDQLDDLQYNPAMHAEQGFIRPSMILTSLEWAYENRNNTALNAKAREFASEYSHTKVYRDYLKPTVLRYMEQREEREERRVTRKALRIQHEMSTNVYKPPSDKAPVVLTVFNRPDHTARVMEAIAKWQPSQLFVIQDGARPNATGFEKLAVEGVHALITEMVDWDCDVQWLRAETNLGPDRRLPSGFSWVFSQVDRAIVLEDDLVPEDGFFDYCNDLLNKYQHDPRVAFISGFNYSGEDDIESDYRFTRWAGSWGWATWKRTWDAYRPDAEFGSAERLHDIFRDDPMQRDIALTVNAHLPRLTYDYAWLMSRILSGLGICPRRNLIRNIGAGADATHMTNANDKWAFHPSWPIELPLKHPETMDVNIELDRTALEAGALGNLFQFHGERQSA